MGALVCMEDYRIGYAMRGVGKQVTTDTTLPPNAKRWGFSLFGGDFTCQVRVFAGTDNTGVPLGVVVVTGGTSGITITRLQAGQLVAGPLYFNGNGASVYGVVELVQVGDLGDEARKGVT